MLLTGPDLLANLLGNILRFREKRYPLSAEIEALYMQVSVHPAGRKCFDFSGAKINPTFSNYFVSPLEQNALQHTLFLLSKPVLTNMRRLNASFETNLTWLIFSFSVRRFQKLSVSSTICDSSFNKEGLI